MMKREIHAYAGNVVGAVFTALQTEQIMQYISLALTIIATIFSISFTIYNWYKKASEDGKITKDEIDDLVDDIKGSIKDNKEDK